MKKIISSILIFAMLFTLVPTVFAESVYEMNFGETTYTVAPGEEIKIPLYFNATADPATAVTVETVASYIMIPEEISLDDITIESTVLTADDYNKDDSFHEVVVIGTVAGELNNTTPIITMTVKAPAETGEYKFEMYDSAAYYKDTAGKEVKYQGVGEVPTTLIVEENVTPQPPASEYDYEMKLVPSATEVEAGSTFTLPLYFVSTADTTGTVTVETVASYIMIPEEISLDDITIESTVLTADDYNKDDSYHEVVVIGTVAGELNNNTPIITMTVKAPAETGEYKFEMYDSAAYYKDTAGKEVKYQDVGEIAATITVTGGSVTPDPDVKSLVVEPSNVTVPYDKQNDIAGYIDSQITSAIYYLNDEAGLNVRDSITVDDNGLVTYNDGTANVTFQITVTLEEAPTVTSIASDVTAITVPYGEDETDYALAEANKGTVTATYSNGSKATVTPESVDYENGVVTIAFGGQTTTIPVTVTTATELKLSTASVVVPFGGDVEAYVKANVTVKVVLSNNTEVAPLGEVEYTVNDTTVTIKVDGLEADVAYTMGANPEEIVSIEADVAEVAVPYANKDAVEAYIAANVKITATKNEGTEVVGITAENVALADGIATITVAGVSTTVNYTVETITGIVAEPAALDVAWTIEDIEAYVAANVKVYYTYSAATANSEVPAELVSVAVDKAEGKATITVDGYDAVEVTLNIEATPDYTVDVITPVYGLEGHKALVITMNVDGVPYVDGVAAVKVADKKFVFVTDAEEPVIEVKEETADIVAWGELHLAGKVTAYDALIALKAGEGIIADELLADDNVYVAGDIDLDWDLDGDDALAIINIGLGRTVTVSTAE